MKRNILIAVVVSAAAFVGVEMTSGRGFGGGGGGFHGGGGFGGGGGGFGGGGFGGGGFGGGDRGAGGFGGGGFGGGGFGGAGGDRGAGGFGGGGFGGAGGLGGGGLGGQFGGNASRGAGGFGAGGLGGGGFGGQFGDASRGASGFGANSFRSAGGAGGFGGLDSSRFASAPSASRLNSFLGLPSDMGMHQASGAEHQYGYAGSAQGVTGLNASAAGERGASGGVWTGPNGATVAHGSAGERGAVVGPDGAAAGERGVSGTVVKGPDGGVYAHGEAGERGVVAGPNGVAGGSRAVGGTAVRGPDGNVYARGGEVTRGYSAADLRVNGNYARANFNHYDAFNNNWYHDRPGAWYAAGFRAGAWSTATWADLNGWFGAAWPAYGYSYGNDITYVDNNVCLYGQPIATADEYYQSAADLAQTGEEADIPDESPPQNTQQAAPASGANAQWLPLGVFEAIPAGQKSSKMMFQLAVNKDGIVRGNYYDTGDQNTQLIEGSVDKATQRVAWAVADKKDIIFDTGLYNLTKDETTVLVHFSKDKTEQWTLVRLKQPAGETANQ